MLSSAVERPTISQKTTKDRALRDAAMRAGLRMAQMDLEAGVEFYEQTARYFRKKMATRETRLKSHPDSYWEQDVGYGTTRGELAAEGGEELEHMLRLNAYFGILSVYSAFERYVLRTFQDMKHLKLVKKKYQKKAFLTLDEYKKCFKSVGIDLTKSPFQVERDSEVTKYAERNCTSGRLRSS